jgi:DNA-binding NarL/FixJ family response regulator
VRLLIVDDSDDFVGAARGLLAAEGITVVGATSTGADALRRCDDLHPDVVLVDVDLGGESGFDVAEQLHAAGSSAATILISTHAGADFLDMIADSHAVGFISKTRLSGHTILELVGGLAGLQEGDHR